ncbi:MAG: hypothetical protein HC916_12790 [Coleofasciculaceae cyanobacterium SM2_1_6]|nr:hypothetical protein [Coleofasciculaceae cyanobacterium SM2_1_6]
MITIKPPVNANVSSPALARADRAFLCSPFLLPFLLCMQITSISLADITGATGVEKGYTQKPLSELAAESAVMWLIQVGLVRREVDGQGITDSFRLTLLGRQIVGNYEKSGNPMPNPSWFDRLRNWLDRWFRLPF